MNRAWPPNHPGLIFQHLIENSPRLRTMYSKHFLRPVRRQLERFVKPLIPKLFYNNKYVKQRYYRFSYFWWRHPSNGHWAFSSIVCTCNLHPQERCFKCGNYTSASCQEASYN